MNFLPSRLFKFQDLFSLKVNNLRMLSAEIFQGAYRVIY